MVVSLVSERSRTHNVRVKLEELTDRRMSVHRAMLTLRNMEQTNGCFFGIGAQQNTYRARKARGTCSIISARNLKSSVLHMK